MTKLSDLPNIGKELEMRLERIGISSAEELIAIGSKEAFLKLNVVDENSCYNLLYALEGAIQGIRWHHLDKDTKLDLKEYINSLQV